VIFRSRKRSYRELPWRVADFGRLHRYERGGVVHGLARVRSFAQDDAHIFCAESQVSAEIARFMRFFYRVYKAFGFESIDIKLATRPEKRIGSDDLWDRAEKGLADGLRDAGLTFEITPGEGAFYGPKIEYHLADSIGRPWQMGTMQVDFQLPGRLGAEYVAEDNTRKTPVMLHRAIVGSLERFIGVLVEHHAGAMPLWLAPVQAVVLNITDRQAAYARDVEARLKAAGFRVAADLRNEKITYKIREHSLQKLPYQLIVGDKELQAVQVAVRTRGGEDLGTMSQDALLARLREEVAARH
jgi:threonyl-tRNA synthetase